jgi:hypothetical protein
MAEIGVNNAFWRNHAVTSGIFRAKMARYADRAVPGGKLLNIHFAL